MDLFTTNIFDIKTAISEIQISLLKKDQLQLNLFKPLAFTQRKSLAKLRQVWIFSGGLCLGWLGVGLMAGAQQCSDLVATHMSQRKILWPTCDSSAGSMV
jgi:hypothetical protein